MEYASIDIILKVYLALNCRVKHVIGNAEYIALDNEYMRRFHNGITASKIFD